MTRQYVPMEPSDAGRLALLHMEAFDDPWSAASFRGLLLEATVMTLGLEEDGELIAFVMVQTIAGESDILTVATQPERRRQGIARDLIREMMERLSAQGVTRMTLDVAEDNDPARALYRDLGFTEDGRRPRYYTGKRAVPVDGILMSHDLTSDSPNPAH